MEIGDIVVYRAVPKANPSYVGVITYVDDHQGGIWGFFAQDGEALSRLAWAREGSLEKIGTISQFGITLWEIKRLHKAAER